MTLHDYFHVLNPSSHWRDSVYSFIKTEPSLRLQWVEKMSHPTHLETILNWSLVEQQKKICIWGGDGTINRSLQFFADRNVLDKVDLALVPVGTCNDFFRKNYSHENEGIRQHFDLGSLVAENGQRVFLNNAGFGRESKAIRSKPRHPLLDILSLTEKSIRLEWVEKGSLESKAISAYLGIVCNSPYFNCGLHFDKACDPKDSLLNGYFEKSSSKGLLVLKFIMGRLGKSLSSPNTVSVKSPKITVASEADLYPQVDGEMAMLGPIRKLIFEIQPKALSLSLYKRPF